MTEERPNQLNPPTRHQQAKPCKTDTAKKPTSTDKGFRRRHPHFGARADCSFWHSFIFQAWLVTDKAADKVMKRGACFGISDGPCSVSGRHRQGHRQGTDKGFHREERHRQGKTDKAPTRLVPDKPGLSPTKVFFQLSIVCIYTHIYIHIFLY